MENTAKNTGVLTIDIEGVVVEAGVAEESVPLAPPGGYMLTHVLVQVLPKVPGRVATVLKYRCQC